MARSRKKAQELAATETPAEQSRPEVTTEPAPAQPAVSIQPEGIVHAPVTEHPVAEQHRPMTEERQAAHENGHQPHSHAERHHKHREHASGFIANPSSKRRESHAEGVRKLPGKLMVKAGDLAVRMIDAGDNRMGIGIKVEVPEGRTLTHEEKDIIRKHVRGEEGEHTGFRWDHDNRMWHKAIVQNFENPDEIPPTRPVAIRLDAESRVEKLAEALRQHHGKAEGFVQAEEHRERVHSHGGRS